MATELNTTTYQKLNTDLQDILKRGALPTISIYSDAASTQVVSDSHGDIKDRQVMSVTYTESYKGADGNPTLPFITVVFLDGSTFTETFTAVDSENEYWYTLSTLEVPYTRFGGN